MRKINSFVIGFLCAALLFGGTTVLANTDVLAKITSQIFFWNNEAIELPAYNINGNNYVKLRDVAKIFGVDVEYYEDTNSVYLGEQPKQETQKKVIDGNAYAKEDYSLSANPEIFNDVYTKDAYNAIRQSIVDITEITKNTDDNGFNADYEYAHFIDKDFSMSNSGKTIEAMKSVTAKLSGYYNFTLGYEPDVDNLNEYLGYRICKVQIHKHFEPANRATDSFIAELDGLSDKEKVRKIADYICDRVAYKDVDAAGVNGVFTETPPVNAICGTYADAFLYLCQRAGIPCVSVTDELHAWNEVYVDGRWYKTDISYYDVAQTDSALFPKTFNHIDEDSAKTKFAKELLVPMSTK